MTILPVHRICPRCQASNASEATICRACGANINERLAVTRAAAITLPAITRREVGTTVAVAAAAVALRIGRRLVAAWWAKRSAPTAPSSEVVPFTAQSAPAFRVIRKTWWHVSGSDGRSQWGSQQDTWDIEPQ